MCTCFSKPHGIDMFNDMTPHEALRTFNCGIGMVLIVDPSKVKDITNVLTTHGETVYVLGKTIVQNEGEPTVIVLNEGILKA